MSWRDITLGALCAEGGGGIQTGPFGSQLHAADYVLDGVPSVMPQNIGDNVIDERGIARITPDDAARLEKYLLVEGDIVYSRRGDVEKRALVRAHNEGWLCGTGCLRVRVGDSSRADARFVSYLLGVPETRGWISRHAVGATMPNLNTKILSSVPLRVPSITRQRAIAEVLGALDDKIAANNKIALTADALVRADYLGLRRDHRIPVGQLVMHRREAVDPRNLEPETNYVGLEHVPRRSMWMSDSGIASTITSDKSKFSEGDILFGKLRPYFHKVIYASTSGICSTDIMVLEPSAAKFSGFALAALASDEVVAEVTAASEGTRMPRTNWKDLAAVEVRWPGDDLASEFSTRVNVIRDSAVSYIAESRKLAELRNTLLPELMSGRLRVKDAEKKIEEVV